MADQVAKVESNKVWNEDSTIVRL